MCDPLEGLDFYALSPSKDSTSPWYKKLSIEEHTFYSSLYRLIVLEPNVEQVNMTLTMLMSILTMLILMNWIESALILQLIAYLVQVKDKALVTEWINKNIVTIHPPQHDDHQEQQQKLFQRRRRSTIVKQLSADEGVFYANNLCHLATKNNLREVVHFMVVHCGGDLSKKCMKVEVNSDSNADLEPSDSLFSMIMSTFNGPVEFLKDVLNSGVQLSYEDGSQLRKTFQFGALFEY